MIRHVPLAGSVVLSLALLGACTESEPPPTAPPPGSGCVTDADCAAGEHCVGSGSCEDPGSGGTGGGDECKASDDCRAEFTNIPSLFWDGEPGIDRVCTEPRRSCPGAVSCDVATVCADVLDGATRPGGVLCERDDQCWSGRCLIADGAAGSGICLRACESDGDCPYVHDAGTPIGLTCNLLVVENVSIASCTPTGAPEATLCRNDGDCSPSDDAAPPAGGRRCRYAGAVDYLGHAVPLCELPPADLRPTGAVCSAGASCEGGACFRPCESNQIGSLEHFCDSGVTRCTQPCDDDRDCPARRSCASTMEYQRAGDWLLPFQPAELPGRALRVCILPAEGCDDELQCYPEVEFSGAQYHGWSDARTRCSVVIAPPASRPHLLTQCRPIDGRTAPGGCCAAHADCDSDLCVPARAGSPCDGGGVCSVPCDPAPDPDGVPGSGDEQDSCALLDFGASLYHLESSCQPFLYTFAGPDPGTPISVELRACQ